MTKALIQIFLAAYLLISTEIFASVDIPSDYSDLTKSILDENPTSEYHFSSGSDVDEDAQSASVKSESQYSDVYGQPSDPNDRLSVLDVVLRKRRTEESTKPEEKVLDIPHAGKLPIKDNVSELVANDQPTIEEVKTEKDPHEERPHVHPITFKLTSLTNRDDNTNRDKKFDDDKAKDETVKIIVDSHDRITS